MFFVEIVRLFIVLLCTAAGYGLAGAGPSGPGRGAIVGAIVGALVGYVVGGVFARQLRRGMGRVEEHVARAPAAELLAGAVGASVLGVLAGLIGIPAVVLVPTPWGWALFVVVVWTGIYEGFQVGSRKTSELLGLAGLSARTMPLAAITTPTPGAALVDTSAVIDGRLPAVVRAGFLRAQLLVPRFVLDELQGIADSADATRRRRGRSGLESLDTLRHDCEVVVVDDEVPELHSVDAKLVALARRLAVDLVTTDSNLAQSAELQGVRCLNLNRLADGLRPAVMPGEVIPVAIAREGKEPGQGVGFLDDGTMVVVGGGAGLVGRDVAVRITSNVQTSVGRMLFASVA